MAIPWLVGIAAATVAKVAYDSYQEDQEEERRRRERREERRELREREERDTRSQTNKSNHSQAVGQIQNILEAKKDLCDKYVKDFELSEDAKKHLTEQLSHSPADLSAFDTSVARDVDYFSKKMKDDLNEWINIDTDMVVASSGKINRLKSKHNDSQVYINKLTDALQQLK